MEGGILKKLGNLQEHKSLLERCDTLFDFFLFINPEETILLNLRKDIKF